MNRGISCGCDNYTNHYPTEISLSNHHFDIGIVTELSNMIIKSVSD